LYEFAGKDEPAEPESRSEGLARGASIGHPVGVQPVDGADRGAVVAILGVVVVLDD
jgi:hypothetical protein